VRRIPPRVHARGATLRRAARAGECAGALRADLAGGAGVAALAAVRRVSREVAAGRYFRAARTGAREQQRRREEDGLESANHGTIDSQGLRSRQPTTVRRSLRPVGAPIDANAGEENSFRSVRPA
jgi:hypothetical protein